MVKTGQFTTKCKSDRPIAVKRQISLCSTPLRKLSTPLPAKSCGNWRVCALVVLLKWPLIPCYRHIHSKHNFRHDFAGKGVLNAINGVLPKWYLPFSSHDSVHLSLLYLVVNCVACFHCIGVSFFSTKSRDWLGWPSPKRRSDLLRVELDVKLQLTHSLARWEVAYERLRTVP